MKQQKYFFDLLWRKAIPARQRIKEIEENLKWEFIETIQDSEETTSLISKVISSATEEIQMIFSRERLGMFGVVRRKADNGVLVRILVGMDSSIKGKDLGWSNGYPQIELCYLNKSILTKPTAILTAR